MKPRFNFFTICAGFLISLFCIFAINVKDTNAFNFGGTSQTRLVEMTANGYSGGSGTPISVSSTTYRPPSNISMGVTLPTSNVANTVALHDIILRTQGYGNWPAIPANSLFPIQITWYTNSTTDQLYFSRVSIPGMYLVNSECFPTRYVDTSGSSTSIGETTCTYWLYTPRQTNSIQILTDTEFPATALNVVVAGVYIYSVQITSETGGGGSTAPFEGLTETELNGVFRTWLEARLNELHSDGQTTNSLLDDIKGLLEALDVDQAQIQQTMDDIKANQEAQMQQDQQDRDNLEQQASDAEDGADDSQQQAQSTGTTLLAAFSAFVNALTNASPSNCNIDMDLGNLDLGVVNFCQLSPPPGFSAIASVFMILFCVPLSIATARKVISLFRSFQS